MSTNNQPDLARTIAGAINQLAQQHGDRPEQKLPESVSPTHISIPCQRTWYGVETMNQKVNGADFSACVAHVTQADGIYPWFFVVCRLPGDSDWQPIGSQGGERRGMVQQMPGKLHIPRTAVCAGGLGVVPNGGSVRIELPDGTVHEDHANDGCCIAFAPLTSEPEGGKAIMIRYLDASGAEISSEPI